MVLNEGMEVLGPGPLVWDDNYEDGVFENSALEDVVFPSTMHEIKYRVFCNCSRLRMVMLPEKLEYIGPRAFFGCGLESIVIPRSVNTIASFAFAECTSLKSVYFE